MIKLLHARCLSQEIFHLGASADSNWPKHSRRMKLVGWKWLHVLSEMRRSLLTHFSWSSLPLWAQSPPEWVNPPSQSRTHLHTNKPLSDLISPDNAAHRSLQQLCNAHLLRVFFPALAYVCPPSRPVTFVWARRWSPESLLRKERATSDISISFQSLFESVFNIYQKNNKGLFFRENIVFDIEIVMFSLCTATQSPSDTRSHVHTINQSEIEVISVGTRYMVPSLYFKCLQEVHKNCVLYYV